MSTSSYCTKTIRHYGNELAILMQNENGPCPLLAIANVLILRGGIYIHPDIAEISFEDLTARMAEYMLDQSATLSETDEVLRANQQRNIADGMALFPKLQRGLDVNVGFTRVDAFEYSEDQVIFDLLSVRLVHGWLSDPQDAETHRVVGALTYNQLVETVIGLSSDQSEPSTPSPAPALPTVPAPLPPAHPAPPAVAGGAPAPTVEEEEDEEAMLALAIALSQGQHPASEVQMATQPPSSLPSPLPPGGPPPPSFEAALQMPPAALAGCAAEGSPSTPASEPMEAKARRLQEGLIAQDWLNCSAAQLTYLGLEQLHRDLQDRALVVFFRNNHFSTLTKHDGELYLLATDIGYLQEQDVVWERLNQVDGDSILCDAQFRSIDLDARAAAAAAAAAEAADAVEARLLSCCNQSAPPPPP